MSRSVKVTLEADVGKYTVPIIAAKEETEKLDNKVEGLNRDLDKTPAAAARAAAAMKLLGGDAKGAGQQLNDLGPNATNSLELIDRKLVSTRAEIKKFADDFNKTGSVDSFNLWQSATKDLKGLERLKKDLSTALGDGATDAGKKAGKDFGVSFMGSLGIAAAGAAPFLGSVLGAAVIGGGGLSLIGLGIIGQVKNPEVRAAFSSLAGTAKADLTAASSAFGPELVKGADALGTEMDKITPKLQAMLDRLAPVFDKLLGGGIGFFDRMLPGLDALSRAAGPVLAELATDLPRLGGALSSMFQSISAGAPGAANGLHALFTIVDGLIIGLGKLIQGFEMLPGPVQAALAIVGLLGAAFLFLGPKVLAAKEALSGLADGSLAADTKLGSLTRTAGKVALALAAVQAVSAAMGHSDTTGVDTTTKSLNDLMDAGKKTSDVTKHLDYDLGTLSSSGLAKAGNAIASVVEQGTGLGGVFDESLQHAKERIASIDAALAAEVQNGNAVEAARQFQVLQNAAEMQGISIDDLKKGLPQYENAVAAAGKASGQAGDQADTAAGQWDNLATRMADAATKADALKKGMDTLFGITMGVQQATLQYNVGLTNLEKSLDKNGTTLKITDEAGQKNIGVINAQIDKINTLRDANIANGQGIDWSNQQADAQYVQLEKMLVQWGYNKDAVHALIDQYRAIPSSVSTIVNVLGLDAATTKLDSVTQKFDQLNGRVVTTYVVTDTTTGQQSTHRTQRGVQRWGGVYEHAETGLLNAGIYPATSPARYAFAEPATGGEAFVPKFGDYGRSTGIIDQAARWYGGRFAPTGGAGGGTLRVELAFAGGNDALSSLLMKMQRTGDLQLTATRV